MSARRAVTDAVGLGALAGIAFVAVVVFQPGHWRLALHAYLLFAGALALLALTRVVTAVIAAEAEPDFEAALRDARAPRRFEREPQLPTVARLEREVTLASANAFDLHIRLRPTLREIADHRLFDAHGVGLDDEPERARAILGDEVWDLVRPDREPPRDRHAVGLRTADLRRVVERLEVL